MDLNILNFCSEESVRLREKAKPKSGEWENENRVGLKERLEICEIAREEDRGRRGPLSSLCITGARWILVTSDTSIAGGSRLPNQRPPHLRYPSRNNITLLFTQFGTPEWFCHGQERSDRYVILIKSHRLTRMFTRYDLRTFVSGARKARIWTWMVVFAIGLEIWPTHIIDVLAQGIGTRKRYKDKGQARYR